MKKKKVAPRTSKTKISKSKKRTSVGVNVYATEHDFIIIAGGGLVVMLLVTLFMFGII